MPTVGGSFSAGPVGVISASDAVVIARSYGCRTDGSGTNADAYTDANAVAPITAAIAAAAINAADAGAPGVDAPDAAATAAATIRQGISRDAGDAKNGSRGN